jgi:hypothetical protein
MREEREPTALSLPSLSSWESLEVQESRFDGDQGYDHCCGFETERRLSRAPGQEVLMLCEHH